MIFSLGNKIFQKVIGSDSLDVVVGIAMDNDGNIWLAGHTKGNIHGQNNRGDFDVFIMKFNSNGTQLSMYILYETLLMFSYVIGERLLTRLAGSGDEDRAAGIAIDDNDVWVAGYSRTVDRYGDYDVTLRKFNKQGNDIDPM